MISKTRYIALDGLRGILAITVVFHHLSLLSNSLFMRSAWLSVDLFFVLSGFVISMSYAEKIRTGMQFKDFYRIRFLRLYPLYFVGFILGLLPYFISKNVTLEFDINVVWMGITGLSVLPYFGGYFSDVTPYVSMGSIFPFNSPAWSLFFELFSNIIFYIFVKCCNDNIIFKWVLVFFGIYLISISYYGVHSGYSQANFLGGFPRVLFHFFLGFVIFRYHTKLTLNSSLPIIMIILIILVSFNFGNIYVPYFLLFLISPLAVLVGSRTSVESDSLNGKTLIWLGKISFPLYITHYPIFLILRFIFDSYNLQRITLFCLLTAVAILVAHLLIKLEPVMREFISLLLFKVNRR
jgi:peptidoglycan/LPS O-acetylase OafA/YrhL